MSDREFLELAAKAAGIKLCVWGSKGKENFANVSDAENHKLWNPLTDDGDAFRLASALRLTVYHAELAVVVKHKQYSWEWIGEGVNEDTGDRNASARRAIVRAAAEIGKTM